MERRRNRTPGRFLRRNKPYFLLALTLVLLTAAVIFGVKIMRELRTPAQPSVPASVQEIGLVPPKKAAWRPVASSFHACQLLSGLKASHVFVRQ